jgi:hypothetical protein
MNRTDIGKMESNKDFLVNNTYLDHICVHTKKIFAVIVLLPNEMRKSKEVFQAPPLWVIDLKMKDTKSQTTESSWMSWDQLQLVLVHPEDGGDTILRNVGSYKIHTVSSPRR